MSHNLSAVRRFTWILCAAAVLSLLSPTVFAQTTISTGSIQGTITDPSGAVVGGAKISIRNKGTGRGPDVVTNSSGVYASGALTPGDYTVRVEAKGFRTVEVPVVVQVSTTSAVNATLAVGESSQIVEVQGTQVAVNTEQGIVQGVLTAEQIDNLPANGRNFLDWLSSSPVCRFKRAARSIPLRMAILRFRFKGVSAVLRGLR